VAGTSFWFTEAFLLTMLTKLVALAGGMLPQTPPTPPGHHGRGREKDLVAGEEDSKDDVKHDMLGVVDVMKVAVFGSTPVRLVHHSCKLLGDEVRTFPELHMMWLKGGGEQEEGMLLAK